MQTKRKAISYIVTVNLILIVTKEKARKTKTGHNKTRPKNIFKILISKITED